MTIFLGSDHAGFKLKEAIKHFLVSKGHEIKDFGAFEYKEGDDYPNFIRPVAESVQKNPETDRGIILGGSGEGEAIAANRFKSVRASVYYGGPIGIVQLSRQHNNSNILSLGARFVSEDEALRAVALWLETPFSEEERHKRRLKEIDE